MPTALFAAAYSHVYVCVCVCVCVCVWVGGCVRACVRACVCVRVLMFIYNIGHITVYDVLCGLLCRGGGQQPPPS